MIYRRNTCNTTKVAREIYRLKGAVPVMGLEQLDLFQGFEA